MKKVYVIRHSDKNKETGELTEEGRERAKQFKDKIGKFDLVITSDRLRLTETAFLLTGRSPLIDARAGFVYSSEEQKNKLSLLAKTHPMNHAGVIFELPEFKDLVETIGNNLIDLIRETLTRLPQDGKALVISQDGVMVSAQRTLKNKSYEKLEKSYFPLGGYIVNENLQIEELS